MQKQNEKTQEQIEIELFGGTIRNNDLYDNDDTDTLDRE
jgi:hypothetical protein